MDTRELKNSVKTAAGYLADKGFDVPHTRLLEALSRALGERNWATLRARLDAPTAPVDAADKPAPVVKPWSSADGPMTEAQFVHYRGNRCPFCGSDDLDSGDLEADGPDVSDHTDCGNCGRSWQTAYTVSGYFGASPGAQAPSEAPTPVRFGPHEVLVLTYLNGANLRWMGYAYHAQEVLPVLLSALDLDAENLSKEDLVHAFSAREGDCVEALLDARVLPRLTLEFADVVRAYLETRNAAQHNAYEPLHVYREDVVHDLVGDVSERCKTYEWSTSTLVSCYDAAVSSSEVCNLDATTAELVEAALRLS